MRRYSLKPDCSDNLCDSVHFILKTICFPLGNVSLPQMNGIAAWGFIVYYYFVNNITYRYFESIQ